MLYWLTREGPQAELSTSIDDLTATCSGSVDRVIPGGVVARGLRLHARVCSLWPTLVHLCSATAVEYASIDWHDFVVVETIAFREDESGTLITT